MSQQINVPPPLDSEQPILDSEIAGITKEEFNLNIHKAESFIDNLVGLKLPKGLQDMIQECANQIKQSKKGWWFLKYFQFPLANWQYARTNSIVFEETGNIPDDEALDIHDPRKTTRSMSAHHPHKKVKTCHTPKPVSLQSDESPLSSQHPALEPSMCVPESTTQPSVPVLAPEPPQVPDPYPLGPASPPALAPSSYDPVSQTISPSEIFQQVGAPLSQIQQSGTVTDLSGLSISEGQLCVLLRYVVCYLDDITQH